MKIWAYVALAGVLIGALGGSLRWAYASGYDARDLEVKDEIVEAVARAEAKKDAEWKETLAAAEAQVIVEERIVEKIRTVEKRIPTVVERIVEVTPECADLGPDFLRVLNDQVGAGNDRESPPASPGMAEGMP